MQAGEAYVLFGKASGLASIDLTSLGAGDGFIIQGDAAGDEAGWSVSSAGDVNGDGFDDLIVGAPFGDDGGVDAGEAYVIFGKATGLANIDLTGLTTADGFMIQGDVAFDHAGYSVSSAGDVNGDGFDDLILGARWGDNGGVDAGDAYVIYGRAPLTPVVRTGAARDQTIRGGAFDDSLFGLGGADMLYGADGNDMLDGGAGNDMLFAGSGDNHLVGGTGRDILQGGIGDDTLDGGSDRDIVDFSAAIGALIFTVGSATASAPGLGTDSLVSIEGVYGSAFADTLTGNGTSNTFRGGAGDDIIDGKTGLGVVDFSDATGAIIFSIGVTSFSAPGLGTDTLISIEGVAGTAFSDTLLGDTGINELIGNGGDDVIRGGNGDDIIIGGDGNDTLFGDRDNDTISGGNGNDRAYGGNLNDVINGDAGNDTLVGDAGSDTIHGGTGNDRVYGGTSDDFLFGDDGLDLLAGSGGNDELNGGAGNDRLLGGPDSNRFIFDADSSADRIFSFQDNIDKIVISSSYGYADAATVIAATFASGSAGQNVVIDLGGGDMINVVNWMLGGAHTIADLQNDILIV